MKNAAVLLLAVLMITGLLPARGDAQARLKAPPAEQAPDAEQAPRERTPTAAVAFVLLDSIAFAGLGLDFYLGSFGLGGYISVLPLIGTAGAVLFLEPGVYGRLYFWELDSTLYFTGGVSFWTLTGTGVDEVGSILGYSDYGHLNINTGIGYHAMFGDRYRARFTVEIGPRYTIPTYNGGEGESFFFLHFMTGFGIAF